MGFTQVPLDAARQAARDILVAQGHSAENAAILTEVLLYAQLRGNSQGLVKLTGAGLAMMSPGPRGAQLRVVRETSSLLLADGGQIQGMLLMHELLTRGIPKARDTGVAILGSNNTSSSTGAIGYFADKAARAGLIALIFAGSPPTVTTYGAVERTYGTNPLAVGIPVAGGDPAVVDMATSAMAFFAVHEARQAGVKLPDNVGYDAHGQPTNDPAAILEGGSLRPFETTAKSSALAFTIEALTGPLVRASFAGIGDISNWGNLVILIDPGMMTGDATRFAQEMAAMVSKIRTLRRAPGFKQVFVPGERGNATSAAALARGTVAVEDNLWQTVKDRADLARASKGSKL